MATHTVSEDRAYELLVTVGLVTPDGGEFDVVIESRRLIQDCPTCEHVFDTPDEFVVHHHRG